MRKIFDGVCTAMITPFKKNKVDYKAFGNLITRQIKSGTDALCILGTTGEASTLSYAEKCEIVKFSIEVVNKQIPIIFGIGGNNPTDIINLGKYIRETVQQHSITRSDIGVMVTAPYYNKCTQDGATKFFTTIANAVKLPLIVYNVPSRTGINLLPETLAQICRNKYVYGIKEASGDIIQITNTVKLCNCAVYCGDDVISLPCYSVGCKGIISVASNIKPENIRQIWKYYKSRRIADAQKLFFAEMDFCKSLFRAVNPIPVKDEMSKLNLCRNELRLPLTPIYTQDI